ncbi:MAG: hypothetical protein NWQ26_02010 [Paraglaciecola sp.]|nr:hypothetical protein [Paraglaciecola sp.]
MKLNSIKTRLVLIISICLFGMLILVVNQIYNTQRLVKLNNQNKQLLKLSQGLLQLRRHEKDFMLRLDPHYIEMFRQRAEQFSEQIEQIKSYFDEFTQSERAFNELHSSFVLYHSQFLALSRLQQQIGLDENKGYQGQFRQATHALEQELIAQKRVNMHIVLLQIRRSEKDFLLRKNRQYVEQEQRLYQQLQAAMHSLEPNDEALLQGHLDTYQQGFMQLVAAYQEMGLDHNSGLQGQFRQQAHELEAQLNEVSHQFEILISEAEYQVERNSLLIMAVTSLILIVVLLRSYLTFQRAFLNFVMFFYRCKREYQHMDSNKLGFAEFKYLATIANEMIDARRDIERQLQAAHQHIAKLKQEPEQI